jgi:ribosomal protein L7/L12
MGDAGEFNLIIEKVTSPDAAPFLAEAFGMDGALTQAMLKTTPIIFATKLNKAEVKALTPRLQELSKHGFEFRITAKVAKIPKVNWLIRPNFALPTTGTAQVAFDFQNTAFVCPTCGDAFVFNRVGAVPLSDPTPAAPPASSPPTSAPTPALSSPIQVKSVTLSPQPKPAPEVAKRNNPTEPLKKLELADEVASKNAPTPKPGEFAEADLVEPLTDEALEGGDVAQKADLPEIDLSSIEGPPEGGEEAINPNVKTSVDLSTALDETLAEQEQAVPATPQPGAAGVELYNVFVPEVKDKAKVEEVVKLVMQVRGCSEDEARKLSRRIMIPVAKGVSKDEAERILSQFKKIKTTGRMTKVSPGAPTGE